MYLVVDISFVVSMHCVAKHYHAGCDAVLLITKCVYLKMLLTYLSVYVDFQSVHGMLMRYWLRYY